MKWTAIGVAVTTILCFSSAFAGNGTIRLNVEKNWWSRASGLTEREVRFVRAKCWAEDGHATTHWEKVRPNNHKTCHGAYHMRVDFPEHLTEFYTPTWRFWRSSGPRHGDANTRGEESHYHDCADNQILKVTIRGGSVVVNADHRCVN